MKNPEHLLSPIGTRIRQIKTLINDREIRDYVPLNRLHQGRPIIYRWIFDFAALEHVSRTRTDPVNNLAPPSFDGAHCTTARGNRLRWSNRATGRELVGGCAGDCNGFGHLLDAHLHAIPYVAAFVDRHSK